VTLAKLLLSYWNMRTRGLLGVTRGGCGHLDRRGGNKQHTENNQNSFSHFLSPLSALC
jgi:hypothetical protein